MLRRFWEYGKSRKLEILIYGVTIFFVGVVMYIVYQDVIDLKYAKCSLSVLLLKNTNGCA